MRSFLRNTRAVVLAVGVHVVVLGVLAVSFNWQARPVGATPKPAPEPVQATVVDSAQVEKEIQKLKDREAQREQQEVERQQRLEQLLRDAQQAENKRKTEEARLARLKKEKELEKQKAIEARKKREEEQKRLAALEKKRKAEAERKRKAEAEKKRQADAQKKALAEKKRKEQQERERELQAQIAAEQQRQQAISALDRYIPIIEQHVRRHWNQPPNTANLVSKVRVRLTPGGEVLNASVVLSSGNPAYDRSVEYAVYRASPLPLPPDPALAQLLRSEPITFTFDPRKQG